MVHHSAKRSAYWPEPGKEMGLPDVEHQYHIVGRTEPAVSPATAGVQESSRRSPGKSLTLDPGLGREDG